MWGYLIPNNSTFSIINFNNEYFFVFSASGYISYYYYPLGSTNFISIDLEMNVVYHEFFWTLNSNYSELATFLNGWDNVLGCNINFNSKGSWMRLRRHWPPVVSLNIGLGHYQRIRHDDTVPISYNNHLRSHTILLLGYNWYNLYNVAKQIKFFSPMNSYTKSGISFARQLFYSNQGKENKYKAMNSKIF